MAMISVTPQQVRVRCGWFDGRPRFVEIAGENLRVRRIERIRVEAAAYPAATGPRTCFQVDTIAARLLLVFRHRDRRWLVEGLDFHVSPLPLAA